LGQFEADAFTFNQILAQIASPKDVEILARTLYRTPQAFVFGNRLSDAHVRIINRAIGELKFNGDLDVVLQRWRPPISTKGLW